MDKPDKDKRQKKNERSNKKNPSSSKKELPQVHNPHDVLFKWAFKTPQHAMGPLRAMLQPALAKAIDWSTLQRIPASYVDDDLRELHSDLLFRVQLRGRSGRQQPERLLFLYLLKEHQSSCDPRMPARMYVYLARWLASWMNDHPEALLVPAIVPLVSYHGNGGWTAPRQLTDMIDLPRDLLQVCRPHLPELRYLLNDLTSLSEQDILARETSALARLVELVLVHARSDRDLLLRLERWGPLLREVHRMPDGSKTLQVVFRYILTVNPEVTSRKLMDHLNPLFDDDDALLDQVLISEAEFIEEMRQAFREKAREEGLLEGRRDGLLEGRRDGLLEGRRDGLLEGRRDGLLEGRRDGLLEGRLEGKCALLERLLRTKFGDVPEPVVERIRAATLDQLDGWADRILTASSLDELFAESG